MKTKKEKFPELHCAQELGASVHTVQSRDRSERLGYLLARVGAAKSGPAPSGAFTRSGGGSAGSPTPGVRCRNAMSGSRLWEVMAARATLLRIESTE
jgi:hypothetical protein